MYRRNFCAECGARLPQKSWRAWLHRGVCADCARRAGMNVWAQPLITVGVIAVVAFAFGRYLRPAPPPLVIQRAANSPLSDLPVNSNESATTNRRQNNSSNRNAGPVNAATSDDAIYICGARTKKGTPCQRRVHFAGERCYQHKGRPAMVPLEKLVIKP